MTNEKDKSSHSLLQGNVVRGIRKGDRSCAQQYAGKNYVSITVQLSDAGPQIWADMKLYFSKGCEKELAGYVQYHKQSISADWVFIQWLSCKKNQNHKQKRRSAC